jgi:uncharacterized protein (DUF2235 family)
MAKNIVLLSDGTGKTAATLFTTNVWRLYQALDLSDPDRQVAYYDDGVGTSSFKPLALLGGIFGFGLKRNVLDIYRFLCRHHNAPPEPHDRPKTDDPAAATGVVPAEGKANDPGTAEPATSDRIYGFGFSRGSFTMRVVAGLVASQGLATYGNDEDQLARDARDAYRLYRKRFKTMPRIETPLRWLRDKVIRLWRGLLGIPQFDPKLQRRLEPHAIHFLGLWDTVAAYGGPLEEITRGIDFFVWPLSTPDRLMSDRIKRACHAVALDDERRAFWPVLWDERYVKDPEGRPHRMTHPPVDPNLPAVDRERLSQVWFVGMHSDVGGGYPEAGLSYVALDWMMDRAVAYDLLIQPAERTRLSLLLNTFDKLHDSRRGLGGYYRYEPHKLADLYAVDPVKRVHISDLMQGVQNLFKGDQGGAHLRGDLAPCPTIHESVFPRIEANTDGYAPIVLPETYQVTTKAGAIGSGIYEHATQATMRKHRQETAWNWVSVRRVVYFATVFASLYLAALPLINVKWPGLGQASWAEMLIPVADGVGEVLPNFVSPWIDAFKAAPERLAVGGIALIVLLSLGGYLQRRIFDKMRPIWREIISAGPVSVAPSREPTNWLYRLRTSPLPRGLLYVLSHWVLPFIAALVIYVLLVYVLAVVATRIVFPTATMLGYVCEPAKQPPPDPVKFDTRNLCQPTGVKVVEGKTYRVTFTKGALPWEDGHKYEKPEEAGIPTGPNGFGWDSMSWKMIGGIPLRRFVSVNWFQAIVRVGSTGLDEQPLTFTPKSGPKTSAEATFKARSSGEVFLFVNDSVLVLPRLSQFFYDNNMGTAEVKIDLVP